MSWAHVQSTSVITAATAATIGVAYGSNVTAASDLICTVTWYNPAGTITCDSVVDSRSQTWTRLPNSKCTVASIGGSWSLESFYFLNTTAGANTVTATLSLTITDRGIAVSEYSGLATVSALDQSTSNPQVDPGTATDGVFSTNVTTTVTNELIYGASMLIGGGGGSPVVGTGYTQRVNNTTGANYYLLVEDKNLAAAGTANATFTSNSATEDTATMVATFKEPTVATPFLGNDTAIGQPTNHWRTDIIMARQRNDVVPYLLTTTTRVTSAVDWMQQTVDVNWTTQ